MRKLFPLLSLAVLLTSCEEIFVGVLGLSAGIIGIVALAYFLIIGYAIYKLLTSAHGTTSKVIWGLIIFLVPFLGALGYLFLGDSLSFDRNM